MASGSKRGRPPSAADVLLNTPSDPSVSAEVTRQLRERFVARAFDDAVTIAIHDDAFRKRLAAKLRQLGEGRPRRKTPPIDIQQVASAVELMTHVHAGTRKAHLLKMPRLFDELARFLSITPSQARERYYMAAKRGLLPNGDS